MVGNGLWHKETEPVSELRRALNGGWAAAFASGAQMRPVQSGLRL